MKKALIIASCGVILALIIGATQSHPEDDKKPRFNTIKCLDSTDAKEKTECAARMLSHPNLHSEIFMRAIKRKARYYYA